MQRYLFGVFIAFIFWMNIAYGLTVYDIQYSTSGSSPYDGEIVTVSGVVTGGNYDGDKYFISDPEGGPWHGVHVYDWAYSVSVGDYVTLTAEVDEFYDLTELTDVSSLSIDSTGAVPEPYITTCADADTSESLEGVLIQIEDAIVTSVAADEWEITDDSGTLLIKNNFDYSYSPTVGDSVESIVGLIMYDYGEYFLEPRNDDDIIFVTDTSGDTTIDTTLTAIADIQANPGDYDVVTIEGVITVPAGAVIATMLKAYIQDESGMGIQVFDFDTTTQYNTDFVRGAVLRIQGEIEDYEGITEIENFTYEVIGTDEMPLPYNVVDIWADATDYEGAWVEVEGNVIDVYNTDGANYNVTIDAGGGIDVPLRFWETSGINADSIEIGHRLRIRGVGSVYDSSFQLVPALPEDIEWLEPDTTTPDTNLTAIADIQANPGSFNNVTIEGVITVPAGAIIATMLKAYIQDESGMGIQVFDFELTAQHETDLVRGAVLQIQGQIEDYEGITEIKNITYEVIGTDTIPAPTLIADIWADAAAYEGTWIEVRGRVIDLYNTGGDDYNLTVYSEEGYSVLSRIWGTTGIDGGDYSVGQNLIIQGVGSIYGEEFQLVPALPEDIEEYEPDTSFTTPADEINLQIEEGVLAPSLGEKIEIVFSVPDGYRATMRLFDRRGRSIATLYEGTPLSAVTLDWDGRDETSSLVPAGAYLLHLSAVSTTGAKESKTATLVVGSKLK